MSLAEEPVLHRLVVEVKYREGLVYLDRCGSIMVSLQRQLGEPFKGSVPTMNTAELKSSAERLFVRYGPDSLVVDQAWLETPARVEKVAPTAWQEVAKTLDLESKVTQCGMRAWLHWRSDSAREAQAVQHSAELLGETETWTSLFGEPKSRSFAATSELPDGRLLRAAVDSVEMIVQGGKVAPDDEKFAMRYALQLDLDFLLLAPDSLPRERLQKFIRSSVNDLNRISKSVNTVLNAKRSSNPVPS